MSTTKPSIEYFKLFNPILESEPKLQRVSYRLYPIQVEKLSVETLINSGGKVNAMNLDFAKEFGLRICESKVDAQKSDGSKLDTLGMVIISF